MSIKSFSKKAGKFAMAAIVAVPAIATTPDFDLQNGISLRFNEAHALWCGKDKNGKKIYGTTMSAYSKKHGVYTSVYFTANKNVNNSCANKKGATLKSARTKAESACEEYTRATLKKYGKKEPARCYERIAYGPDGRIIRQGPSRPALVSSLRQ